MNDMSDVVPLSQHVSLVVRLHRLTLRSTMESAQRAVPTWPNGAHSSTTPMSFLVIPAFIMKSLG
jgi:hypothetical protein